MDIWEGPEGIRLEVEEKKLCLKCNGRGYGIMEPCSCLDGWRYSYRPMTVGEVEDFHATNDAGYFNAIEGRGGIYKGQRVRVK